MVYPSCPMHAAILCGGFQEQDLALCRVYGFLVTPAEALTHRDLTVDRCTDKGNTSMLRGSCSVQNGFF
jgi:hypothetical protein